ncbi:MAG: hypothetical protein AAGG51_02075 [Cyanobacteria bacterium P01_G01_bin.54]
MTLSPRPQPAPNRAQQPVKWTIRRFEQGMALLSTVSLLLVCFDLSYIPLRDFWLQGRVTFFSFKWGKVERSVPKEPIVLFSEPWVTPLYDPFKGIEPYRETEEYLETVEQFESAVFEHGLSSSQAEEILQELRERSEEMIDTNPFQIANKTGTLERIKNLMRDHVGAASSRGAFRKFWSQNYLEDKNAGKELEFFKQKIQPLMETNYFRPIGENGRPVDNFGIIDFPFGMIFLVEFIARTWFISQRRKGVSWRDAMLWRWYDVFLFLPVPYWLRFVRLLRILPVMIRLNETKLIDLQKIKKQASQGFVAGIAEDLTEVVVVSLLNQVQSSIKQGEITAFLVQQHQNEYIDLNDTNEVVEIARLVSQVLVDRVIPAAREDLETLVKYSIEKVLKNSPAYQGLSQLPGVEDLRSNLTHQIVHGFYDILHFQIRNIVKTDPTFDQLLEKLSETLTDSMRNEIQTQQSIERMEYLLHALIEEVKINYVQRLSEEDVEELMDQTRALRQVTQVSAQRY